MTKGRVGHPEKWKVAQTLKRRDEPAKRDEDTMQTSTKVEETEMNEERLGRDWEWSWDWLSCLEKKRGTESVFEACDSMADLDWRFAVSLVAAEMGRQSNDVPFARGCESANAGSSEDHDGCTLQHPRRAMGQRCSHLGIHHRHTDSFRW
jgi:hypothetical protein